MKTFLAILAIFITGAQAQTEAACLMGEMSNLNVQGMVCDTDAYIALLNVGGPLAGVNGIEPIQLEEVCSTQNQCTQVLQIAAESVCSITDVISTLCARDGTGNFCSAIRMEFTDLIALPAVCPGACDANCRNVLETTFDCCARSENTILGWLGEANVDCQDLKTTCDTGDNTPPPDQTPAGVECYRENRNDLVAEVAAECYNRINTLIENPTNPITQVDLADLCDDDMCAPEIQEFLTSRCEDPDIIRAICSKENNDDRFCLSLGPLMFVEELTNISVAECGNTNCDNSPTCRAAVTGLTCCYDAVSIFAKFLGIEIPLPDDCSIETCDIPLNLRDGANPLQSLPVSLLIAILLGAIALIM